MEQQLQTQQVPTDAMANLSLDQAESEARSGVAELAFKPLKVAAFNIRNFAEKKSRENDVTDILLKIINRYDVIVIQEVRDKDQTLIDLIIRNLNKMDPKDPFTSVESEKVGRNDCKEQYVFLYRPSRLIVSDTYQFGDGLGDATDVFQREPFAVRFKSPTTELTDFAMITIHTDPQDAEKEVGALHTVYDVTKAHWNLEDILIVGDYNADEGYVDQDGWFKIKLRTDRRFKWLIGDSNDTSDGNTDRAYGRFVVVGKKLKQAIVPESTGVYRFDEDLELSKEEAGDVSDHYPIELQLHGKVNHVAQKDISTDVSVVIRREKPLTSLDGARDMYRVKERSGFKTILLKEDTSMYEVRATKRNVTNVIKTLKEFQETFPGVVNDDTVVIAMAYMTSRLMTSAPFVYGLEPKKWGSYDVTVSVSLQEPHLCTVTISKHVS